MKYGRDHLGGEIYREDDNGNRTYNVSKLKKDLGYDNKSSNSCGGGSEYNNYDVSKKTLIIIGVVSAIAMILLFLFIWFS